MTKKNRLCFCEGISDRDFIYDVFSDKGFVANANQFLQIDGTRNAADIEPVIWNPDGQVDCEECGLNL